MDEALFRANSSASPVSTIPGAQLEKLYEAGEVLKEAIALGGFDFDYVDADGEEDSSTATSVYGREGESYLACKTPVV